MGMSLRIGIVCITPKLRKHYRWSMSKQVGRPTRLLEGIIDYRYDMVPPQLVVGLLRRERARLKRKVRKLRTQKINSLYGWHSEGYVKALDDVLKLMEE